MYNARVSGDRRDENASVIDHDAKSVSVAAAPGPRYTGTAQVLHWLTAAFMFGALPLAWVAVNMPNTEAARETVLTWHKSFGLTIIALVAIRLAWRATHPAPPLTGHLAWWDSQLALLSHWLLYLVMIGMPVTGYLLSAAGGHPVTYFGLFRLPGLPKNEHLAATATWLHVGIGQWAVYALIVLHVAATTWHVAVRRDGVLQRMLPAQRGRQASYGDSR